MKKRKLFYIASILLLLSGCYDDISDILNDAPINKDGSIAFRTDSILTRGTPQNNLEAYDAVHLMVYSHKNAYSDDPSLYRQTELKKSKSADTPPVWEYSPHMFWPEGRKLSFLAYAVEEDIGYATATGKEGVFIRENAENEAPTIEYSVPTDVTLQPDLLVTALLNHEKVNNVTLPMKHALSCVGFCATGPERMKVESITLKQVFSKGTLKLDDPSITWALDPDSKGVTAFEPKIDPSKPLQENPEDGNYLMTTNGYLMMIPQTLTDATIDVVYRDTIKDVKETIVYTLPTTIVWEPGKKYIYKFGEDSEEIVVYYEKYDDESYGFQWNTEKSTPPLPDIINTKKIVEAGYGVLTKSRLVSATPNIQLGTTPPTEIPTKKVVGIAGGYDLYTVNQTGTPGTDTFDLPPTPAPVEIFFDGNNVPCGKIIPHFAKGVSDWNPSDATYYIRTPQQLRNTSAITTTEYNLNPITNPSAGKILKQERDLDFSMTNIGGGELKGPVVDDMYEGTYISTPDKSIYNLTIKASDMDNIGIFSQVNSEIKDVIVKTATIIGKDNVGVIAGQNWWGGQINQARIIGTNTSTGSINITGVNNVGGLVGINRNIIAGNDKIDSATGLTYAEVTGWVNITGSGQRVGGIAGYNADKQINRVLVYGVYSNSSTAGDVTPALIKIRGQQYVGGITGVNDATIEGNMTRAGTDIKHLPDVGGVINIEGGDWVGGIAGMNNGKLNSVNIRLGRKPATTIKATAGYNGGKGTGGNVGGIVGENAGQLGVSVGTFISIRGNIHLIGVNNVGGIVGKNQINGKLENCFVHDFFSQSREYFAPKIECSGNNAGGIAGENFAEIINSSVFSSSTTSTSLISISSNKNAGGLVGSNKTGSKITYCSMVGKIEIKGESQAAGGICGDNEPSTSLTKCWVGNSDGYGIIKKAKDLGLVTTPEGINATYDIPYITGNNYVGGIVGLNNGGVIEGIELKDNVIIGRKDVAAGDGSNWVGGIVGGNGASYQGTTNVIRACLVEQPTGKNIIIQGASNLGGIAGLNNGIIDGCNVKGISKLIIKGMGKIGGIVGQIGGHKEINITDDALGKQDGNDFTSVKNCTVAGIVSLEGDLGGYTSSTSVGGIAGLVGPIKNEYNNIYNCKVGDTSSTISISVGARAGGIAGHNQGIINSCEVRNTTIKAAGNHAGGLVGETQISAMGFTPPKTFRSDIQLCKVYPNVTISAQFIKGGLLGNLNSTEKAVVGDEKPNEISNTGVTINDLDPNGSIISTALASPANVLGYFTGEASISYKFVTF